MFLTGDFDISKELRKGINVGKFFAIVKGSVVDPHHLDADPDSTFHLDADPAPAPDSGFQIKAQTLEKVLK